MTASRFFFNFQALNAKIAAEVEQTARRTTAACTNVENAHIEMMHHRVQSKQTEVIEFFIYQKLL